METTETKGPQLVRPGPIGLGIRVVLGATVVYWFAALLTKLRMASRGKCADSLLRGVAAARTPGPPPLGNPTFCRCPAQPGP
jgi:hypothetical protein